jgi:hypothetical protein
MELHVLRRELPVLCEADAEADPHIHFLPDPASDWRRIQNSFHTPPNTEKLLMKPVGFL